MSKYINAFTSSFYLLFSIISITFYVSLALAGSDQDAAFDERGQVIKNTYGNCVRTKWQNANDPCSPPPPPPPPKQEVRTPPPPPQINLEQRTIYFEFDSAALTPAAVQKLDRIVRVINSSRRIGDVHIIGFADQIGSDSYNQQLSQKRAKVVERYLDQRTRLDTRIADIRGLGEAPDDRKCTGLPRSQQIPCLRYQRRVEIEFKFVR